MKLSEVWLQDPIFSRFWEPRKKATFNSILHTLNDFNLQHKIPSNCCRWLINLFLLCNLHNEIGKKIMGERWWGSSLAFLSLSWIASCNCFIDWICTIIRWLRENELCKNIMKDSLFLCRSHSRYFLHFYRFNDDRITSKY